MNTATLHEKGVSKFVLLEDEDGNLILATNRFAEFHNEIVRGESSKTDKALRCLGGGRLEISEDEIYVYGYSVDFGKPPADLVEQILTENANGKTVRVEIGKGY